MGGSVPGLDEVPLVLNCLSLLDGLVHSPLFTLLFRPQGTTQAADLPNPNGEFMKFSGVSADL